MLNFNQQDQGHFPFLAELEGRVHGLVPYALAGIGAVGGYFWGIGQEHLPVALCIGLGLICGLLLVGILRHLTAFLLGASIVVGLAAGTFFLLQNDAAMKTHGAASTRPAAPAHPGWLQLFLQEVLP